MTIEQMRQRKAELGLSNEQVAERSGVPLGTVQKVFGGKTAVPRYQTRIKLEKLFALPEQGTPKVPVRYSGPYADGDVLELREAVAEYGAALNWQGLRGCGEESGAAVLPVGTISGKTGKKPGEYTVADYCALPEERRAELIDGVFYDMTAPGGPHQIILGELGFQFRAFLKRKQGSCKVFEAPFGVRLEKDDRTMVEPDLMVICSRDKIQEKYCFGAPDLVVEILSPSTRKRDLTLKHGKYAAAGVREYWVVDPERRKVVVFCFEEDALPAIYGFDAKIPVGIWNGELEVDFSEIREELDSIYGRTEDL